MVRTSRWVIAIGLCLLAWAAPPVEAQESSGDVVVQARKLATSGQRGAAIELLSKRLTENPVDVDARVLRGIVLTWEGQYDEARSDLQNALTGHPGYTDASLTLINVELWSDHPDNAEQVARQALKHDANNPDLLLGLARALRAEKRSREAADVLVYLLTFYPANEPAQKMLAALKDGARLWEVGIDHSHEWFSDHRSPWQENQLSIKRQTPLGSVIVRYSEAKRFSSRSNLMELDAYPRIRKGTYAYVNFGYSWDTNLYPHLRAGTDVYQGLGHGFEASGGYRWLDFQTSRVNIFTPSVTKYYGVWLFAVRAYLTPDNVGTSQSLHLNVRRYFRDNGSYIGLRYGRGASVEENHSLLTTKLLHSAMVGGDVNYKLGLYWTIAVKGVAYHDQTLNDSRVNHYLADATIFYRF